MRALFVLFAGLLLVGSAGAHEGQVVDLRQAPPDHQIQAVGYSSIPALIHAGMARDRAFVIFSGPDELKAFLKQTC